MTEDLRPANDRISGTLAMNDLSDDGRSAMRKLITATAVLILLGGSVAVAQNSARTRNSTGSGNAPQTSPNAGGPIEAPIGHKQPRASDVPSKDGLTKLDAEDAALDRKIKSICRGC
jgi:hypothetical protein